MENIWVFWNIQYQHKCLLIGTKPFKIVGIKTQKNKLEVGNPFSKGGQISCNEF